MSPVSSNSTTIYLNLQFSNQSLTTAGSEFEKILEALGKGFDKFVDSAEREFDVFMSGMATDVLKTWDGVEKALADSTKNAIKGTVAAVFKGDMDQVEEIWGRAWDSMVGKVENLWDGLLNNILDRAMNGLGNMFDELVWKPASDWLTDLIPTDWLNLFGKGSSGSAGGGLVGTLQSGAASVASYLGMDSLAAWLGPTIAESADLAALGVGLSEGMAPVAAGLTDTVANSAALWDFGSQASSFSGAVPGLAATLTPMGIALGLGTVGSMLSSMGFLMDGPMTPEEAEANWAGTMGYTEAMTGQMRSLGLDFDEVRQGVGESPFGLFGQSAREAADALEHLRTVAGYSQEQIDALVASLDPLTQEFVASGQAANSLESQVGGLVQEMNAAMNSYTMTGDAVNLYNGRIDALAQSLGLTGESARAFRDEIWDLAQGFSAGGEGAEYFDKALSDLIGNTLGELTQGAEDGALAINGLIDSMGQAQGMGEGLVGLGSTGRGGSPGSSSPAGASSPREDVSLGVMHGGGYVMGWPKAHAGALISSLAHDEVPIIARRGEYVVRAEAVTPAALPALKALNLGAVGTQAAAPAVNLHVEIHGNMLGSRDNLEDLARLLEGKLRELDRARWKA